MIDVDVMVAAGKKCHSRGLSEGLERAAKMADEKAAMYAEKDDAEHYWLSNVLKELANEILAVAAVENEEDGK